MRRISSCKMVVTVSCCFVLLSLALLLPPLSAARTRDLSDSELASIYAYGFSTFTFDGGLATINFNNLTIRTFTEIESMKTGYYNNGTTTGWDNDWTNVSLGSSSSDLTAKGIYIQAKFSNATDGTTRQLDYFRIGTTSLTGTITADFNSFSGTIGGAGISSSRTALGTATMTSNGAGFYLEVNRTGSSMGYTFQWVNATKTP